MTTFDHRDDGTSAQAWASYKAALTPVKVPDPRTHTLAVLAAHPDDESLGAGALITSFLARGGKVEVVLATAGEGADPAASKESNHALTIRRLREFADASSILGAGRGALSTTFLDLPDSKLHVHESLLNEKLEAWYSALRTKVKDAQVILVSPYRHDGHTDHETLGRAARLLASSHHLPLWEYAIWFWHWSSPAESIETKEDWYKFEPSEDELERKNFAIEAHASQLHELGDGQGPILSSRFLQHFDGIEVFKISSPHQKIVHESEEAAHIFNAVHHTDPDPWSCGSSWYEQRKRSLTLGLLRQSSYRHGLEIGCSAGYTTVELASRCDILTATDASDKALSYAAERVSVNTNVELLQGTVPLQWPLSSHAEPFDLVVLSEIGYYLSGQDLVQVDQWIQENSSLDCELLICHWRHPIEGWGNSAESVHRYFLNHQGWHLTSSLVEADTLQHVFVREPHDGS